MKPQKFQTLNHVRYIAFHQNCGIAYALNYILNIVGDFDYLLTMDQDSCFSQAMICKYKNNILNFKENDRCVAVYSINWRQKVDYNEQYEYISGAITSGAIIDINIARQLGGFNEKLFIDQVDFEYCYRARRAGYKILQFNDIKMSHHLGISKRYSFFCVQYDLSFHEGIRKYYILRNNLYVMKRYSDVRFNYFVDMLKLIFCSCFLEKRKLNNLKYLWQGFHDFMKNKWGKYRV